jgi:cleavage and polyadenylation specificity factor subunit 1
VTSVPFPPITILANFWVQDPKSLSGQRLIRRSTFHTGHPISTITLIPSPPPPQTTNPLPSPQQSPHSYNLLLTSHTGRLSLLTPLDEPKYRRLSLLQGQLSTSIETACGLNHRSYRAAGGEGGVSVVRGVLDGALLRRWCELGVQRREEVRGKVGVEVWGIREDLRSLDGGGLIVL